MLISLCSPLLFLFFLSADFRGLYVMLRRTWVVLKSSEVFYLVFSYWRVAAIWLIDWLIWGIVTCSMSGSKVTGAQPFQFRGFCLHSHDLRTEDWMRPGNGGWGGDILSALAWPLTRDILLKIQACCAQHIRVQPRPPWQRLFPSRRTLPRSFLQRFGLIPLCGKVCLVPVLIHLVKP